MIDYNEIINILPVDKREQVQDFIEKIIMELDTDYTMLTPREKTELDRIIKENDYTPADEINWDE